MTHHNETLHPTQKVIARNKGNTNPARPKIGGMIGNLAISCTTWASMGAL